MIVASWMLFAIFTGSIFALAALAAARAASAARRQTRMIWSAALLAVAFWPAIVLAATYGHPPAAGQGILTLPLTLVSRQTAALPEGWAGRLDFLLKLVLLGGWAVLTVILAVRVTRALGTLHRQRDSWRHDNIDGARVRISSDVGPAVVGLGASEIVLPAWVLALDRPLLAMVLRHEEEHRRARDPLLLFGAALLTALVPWNPALWWCARRLRLAVELDCDARVLAQHERPERYGLLLLMIAQRASAGATEFAPALTNPTSNLERRIIAMRRSIPRFARTQLLAFSALAAATIAIACSVDSPEGVTASRSVAGQNPVNDSTAFFEFQVEQPVLAAEHNPAPQYPAALEKARVEGEVLVQFVVNPDGRADMGTFKVLKSSNDLFTQAVKGVLPSMHFVPAEVGGHKVRQLVQMPFGFKLPRK
ncbi:MAG TPA: M56 family metallopeptidase [Gemmatimonadaceae bacterium]|nr:M56 family metallopeptidase [Gemmatimonadaceae bacterium]